MAERQISIAESSNIDSVYHDDETLTLRVVFKGSSGVYTYDQVPIDKADGFASAPSAGKYLNAMVKGQHLHTKIG